MWSTISFITFFSSFRWITRLTFGKTERAIALTDVLASRTWKNRPGRECKEGYERTDAFVFIFRTTIGQRFNLAICGHLKKKMEVRVQPSVRRNGKGNATDSRLKWEFNGNHSSIGLLNDNRLGVRQILSHAVAAPFLPAFCRTDLANARSTSDIWRGPIGKSGRKHFLHRQPLGWPLRRKLFRRITSFLSI